MLADGSSRGDRRVGSQHPDNDDPDAPTSGGGDVPRTYGRYTLLRPLGRRGDCETWVARARARSEPDTFWLLIIRPEPSRGPSFERRFLDVCDAWAKLDHPNLLRVLDSGAESDSVYAATEYVPGLDLDEVLAAASQGSQQLPAEFVFSTLVGLLEGTSFVHERGVAHGAIGPSFVRFSWDGEVKLRAPQLTLRCDLDVAARALARPSSPGSAEDQRDDLLAIRHLLVVFCEQGAAPSDLVGTLPPRVEGRGSTAERLATSRDAVASCLAAVEAMGRPARAERGDASEVLARLFAAGREHGLTRSHASIASFLRDLTAAISRAALPWSKRPSRQDRDEAHERGDFEQELPWGRAYLRSLEEAGFTPASFDPVSNGRRSERSWLIVARPSWALREHFGLAPEVPFLASAGEVGLSDLLRVQDEAVRSELRLDASVVVITDVSSDSLPRRLVTLPGGGQRVAWGPARADTWPPLEQTLRSQLRDFDVFDERDPVRGGQLLERNEELEALFSRVLRGDAVALTGLRKVGKTSLARAVTDYLDPASGMQHPWRGAASARGTTVVWVDAQAVIEETVDAYADEMLRAFHRRSGAASAHGPTATASGGLEALKSTLEPLLERGTRLCVVIDEFDLLFERVATPTPVPGISRLFRLLRSWSQRHRGRASMILIGRDPALLEAPLLDGVTNPLLLWSHTMWLGPMRVPHDAGLLERLGRRVGLEVGPRTLARAREWTGGHPLLLRQLGSALWSVARRRRCPWGADTDALLDESGRLFESSDVVATIAREVTHLLVSRHPDAYALLVELAGEGDPSAAVARRGGFGGPPHRLLKNLGLLTDWDLGVPRFLSTYLRRAAPPLARRAR